MPSQEEIDVHNATHIPFRNWCAFCVAGKAKEDPHFKKDDVSVMENVVSLDYAFLAKKPRVTRREKKRKRQPVMLRMRMRVRIPVLC